MKEIVINWHITQKCNYNCFYCFAHYKKENKQEIHYNKSQIEILLTKIFNFFKETYPDFSLRLNLAGGEPTLSKNLSFIIQKAREKGFKTSLITNGSLLSKNFIKNQASLIDIIGISIDSLNPQIQKQIGRISKNKECLKEYEIKKYISLFREYNSDIFIKINTVVNKYNFKEKFHTFITETKPDKWKVLQALSLNTDKIFCTEQQFNIFVENHKNLSFRTENKEDMKESYIMLDSYGRFYQNTDNKYSYSKSILDISPEKAFQQIKFDINKFCKRYN